MPVRVRDGETPVVPVNDHVGPGAASLLKEGIGKRSVAPDIAARGVVRAAERLVEVPLQLDDERVHHAPQRGADFVRVRRLEEAVANVMSRGHYHAA